MATISLKSTLVDVKTITCFVNIAVTDANNVSIFSRLNVLKIWFWKRIELEDLTT